MEHIVIEVNEDASKKWRIAPAKFKKEVSEIISESFSKLLNDKRKENFLLYLDELGEKMKQRGLTEVALNDILKDDE